MIPDTQQFKKLNKELSDIGKNLTKSVQEIPNAITRELALGANDIRNTIILSMKDTPKTGRHYKAHIASSPGNVPAIDSGELVRSITFDVGNMEIEVGSKGGAPYVVFLEEGTEKMEARPSIGPAVDQHKNNIVKNVGDIAFDVIKRGFK